MRRRGKVAASALVGMVLSTSVVAGGWAASVESLAAEASTGTELVSVTRGGGFADNSSQWVKSLRVV